MYEWRRLCILLLAFHTSLLLAQFTVENEVVAWPLAGAVSLSEHTAIALADNSGVLYYGGRLTAGISSAVYLHNFATSTFTLMNDMSVGASPTGRYDHVAVEYGGSVYVFGGRVGTVSSELWSLAFFGGLNYGWTLVAAAGIAPSARAGHGVALGLVPATLNDGFFIFGGLNSGASPLNDVSVYDFTTNSWASVVTSGGPPSARAHFVMVALSSECFLVYGGSNGGVTVYSDVWEYCSGVGVRPEGWLAHLPQSGNLPGGRYGAAAAILDGRVLLYGGTTGLAVAATLHFYDPVTYTWHLMSTTGSASLPARFGATLTVDGLSQTWAYGGASSGGLVASSSSHGALLSVSLCDPGFASPTGSEPCSSCGPGSYAATPGARSCTLCPAGTYETNSGASACTDCGPGTYSTALGATLMSTCVACSPGSVSASSGADSATDCAACPLSTYQALSGMTSCDACPGGTEIAYQGGTDVGECTDCSPGDFNGGGAGTSCGPCPAGQFSSTPGASVCGTCGTGEYSSLGSSTCSECGAGTYSTAVGATSVFTCVSCPSGSYGELAGQASCQLCPPGSYRVAAGATALAQCLLCPVGTEAPAAGATLPSDCVSCQPGSYADTVGTGTCTLCGAGTYSSVIGATSAAVCSACPAGTALGSPGGADVSDCITCGGGTWAAEGSATCTPCEPGKYRDPAVSVGVSEDTCVLCPGGTYSGLSGASSCTPCPSGTFSLEGWQACGSCTAGPLDSPTSSLLRNSGFEATWMGPPPPLPSSSSSYPSLSSSLSVLAGEAKAWMTAGSISYTMGGGRSGSKSLLMNTGASTTDQVLAFQSTTLNLLNSLPLNLVLWARAASALVGAGSWTVTATLGYDDGSAAVVSQVLDGSLVGVWQRLVLDLPSPYPRTVSVVDVALELLNLAGTVEFDDLTLSINVSSACECSPGFFYEPDYGRCSRCPTGSYCVGSVQRACLDPEFSFGGASECSSCLDGWVCTNGVAVPCLNNTYFDALTASCQECPPGSECINGVRTLCSPGRARPSDPSVDRCVPCEPGSIAPSSGESTCTPCGAGTSSDFMRVACRTCETGEVSVSGGPCTSCPGGTREVGRTSCVPCGLGYFSRPSSTACTPCPIDTFGNVTVLAACYDCPFGTSSPSGSSSCS